MVKTKTKMFLPVSLLTIGSREPDSLQLVPFCEAACTRLHPGGVWASPGERGLTLLLSVVSPKVQAGVVNEELVQKLQITLFV